LDKIQQYWPKCNATTQTDTIPYFRLFNFSTPPHVQCVLSNFRWQFWVWNPSIIKVLFWNLTFFGSELYLKQNWRNSYILNRLYTILPPKLQCRILCPPPPISVQKGFPPNFLLLLQTFLPRNFLDFLRRIRKLCG